MALPVIDRDAERRYVEGQVVKLAQDPAITRQLVYSAHFMATRAEKRAPAWSFVGSLFNTGSTVAYALCRRLDIDPDAKSIRPLLIEDARHAG